MFTFHKPYTVRHQFDMVAGVTRWFYEIMYQDDVLFVVYSLAIANRMVEIANGAYNEGVRDREMGKVFTGMSLDKD